MRLAGLLLLSLFVGFACTNSRTKQRIPEQQLVKILADIHIADALSFSTRFRAEYRNNDSVTYYEKLFTKYGVTRTQFDSTISYYSGNPDKYNQLYDKVIERLNRMAASINEKVHQDSLQTQKDNLWNKKRDWILPEDGATENISFAVKVEKKGIYTLSARVKINLSDQSEKPYMTAFSSRDKINNPEFPDSLYRVKLEKSGFFKLYTISVILNKDTSCYIKGYILANEYKLGHWTKSAEVRDIKLLYHPLSETNKLE